MSEGPRPDHEPETSGGDPDETTSDSEEPPDGGAVDGGSVAGQSEDADTLGGDGASETTFCTSCGAEIDSGAQNCPECGTSQDAAEDESAVGEPMEPQVEGATGPGRERSETKFCTDCGSEIAVRAEICPECGVRQASASTNGKDPAIAAVLSFLISGAGQVYNGQVLRGVAVFLASVTWGIFITTVTLGIGFPLAFAGPIVAAIDAHSQAKKINAGEVVVD